MMTIKTLEGVKQARSYYSAEAGIASYYTAEAAHAHGGGQWYGHGADGLGLSGPVGERQWNEALEGRFGNRQIGLADPEERRPGVDLTFSAPKSVSIMALAVGDNRLIAAHDRAVERALSWVEKNHVHARMGKGGVEKVPTGNLTAALFRHVTARPVNGVTDPQLHTHAVVLNVTQRPDGKWVSINLGMDNDWIKAAGAIYRAELARELIALGYGIVQTPDGFEIVGISRETIEQFSQRGAEIEAELARRGQTRADATAAEKTSINLNTRQGKEKKDGAVLREEWRDRAEAAGLTRERIAVSGPVAHADPATIKADATAAIQSAIRHLAERESAFSSSAILDESSAFGLGKVGVADLELALAREKADGRLHDAIKGRLTTQKAIQMESAFVSRIRNGLGAVAPIANETSEVLQTSDGKVLNAGQTSAAKHILETPDRFVAVQGVAGAGKTTAMQVVREQSEGQGYVVVGLAPTHKAARELRDAGVETVYTVARMNTRAPDLKDPGSTLFIVDESSMISALDMAILVKKIETMGARAAFIGDTRQLQAVEAGSPFRQMQEYAHTATLDEIQRQKNPELKACVEAFAKGDAATGARLAQAFMVEVDLSEAAGISDPKARLAAERALLAEAAAHRYAALTPEDRRTYIVMTGENSSRLAINTVVRQDLQASGELSRFSQSADTLHKVDLTKEAARQVRSYELTESMQEKATKAGREAGLVVEFRRDYQSRGVSEPVEKGRLYDVKAVDQEHKKVTLQDRETGQKIEWEPQKAGKVTVSEKTAIPLAEGDRVVFRANDAERGLINGDRGTVTRVGDEITVTLDRGDREVMVRPDAHMEHAYASTVHSAQGASSDKVIAAQHALSYTATAEQGYVTLSRAREDAIVFTNSKTALAEKWGETKEKETALEVRRDGPAPEPTRAAPVRETPSPSPDFGRSR